MGRFFLRKRCLYLEVLLIHKMVPGEAMLMHKVVPGVPSILMKEYRSWKCALSLKQAGDLVKHLARVPWKETASEETDIRKDYNYWKKYSDVQLRNS